MKHDVAVFNRPFRQVAADYLQTQQRRADTGAVSHDRVKNLRNTFKKALEDYIGSTQIHLIGQDSWAATRRGGAKMDQSGDDTPRHLVSHHVLQFHAHHVQYGDASARG